MVYVENEAKYTTVRVLKTNLERLKKHGVIGDSMDVVIAKVLDKAEG